jgi:hypothetical protein
LAQNVPDTVIDNRRCHLYENGTHSVWISNNAMLPEIDAITWNSTVGDWVYRAIREARLSSYRPNREGCPLPNLSASN